MPARAEPAGPRAAPDRPPPGDSHEAKRRRLIDELRQAGPGASLGLGKPRSNLYRDRRRAAQRLNVRDFNAVLDYNAAEGWVEAEGMTTYADLAAFLLPRGFMPAVVPQLKSITIGGAVSGLGIEATSFRQGLVHETAVALEVLLSDGRVLECTPDNGHRDLFFGLPNSYGTLGYILKLKARIIPARRYVRVEHRRFSAARYFFRALEAACGSDADFVDGVVFAADELVLSVARFVDTAPAVSDYTWRRVYYKSLREKTVDHLSAEGYLWRWDTDWFWGSRHFFLENPLLRLLAGRRFLNSATYTRLMRLESRWGVLKRLNRRRGLHGESVVQDVLIPIGRCDEFLEFLLREIAITPIWICPSRSPQPDADYPLIPDHAQGLGVDFGFWDTKWTPEAHPPGFFNRLIERETVRLHGFKSLYSESYFPREEFRALYESAGYDPLKARYDPAGRLRGLYEKCVLAQ